MTISLVAAMNKKMVIGKSGSLPWKLPEDLRRFKRLTLEHPVIMGRKTLEAIGRPLPGRVNIVLTHYKSYLAPGCQVVHSREEALARAEETQKDEVFIIGGAEIYAQFLEKADKMYLTLVDYDGGGDARFPEFDAGQWIETERVENKKDETNEYDYTFVTLVRKK